MNANLESTTSNIHDPLDRLIPVFKRQYTDFESTRSMKLERPLDSVTCHNHKGHRSSLVELQSQTKCGSDERPSSIELFALAALTEREIAEVDRNALNECYFTFPVCFIYFDI